MHFHRLLREEDTAPWPDTWSPSEGSLKVGCLAVGALFAFASSQRRLPVSTNRPQERSKARAGEFREEELRMAILSPCNGRVEIYVDSWSQGGGHRGWRPNSQGTGPWSGCAHPVLTPPPGSPGDLPIPESRPHGEAASPSRAVLVPLRAQGAPCRAQAAARGDRGIREPALRPPRPSPTPALQAGRRRPGAPRGAQARRRLSLTHSRGRNADGRAALWSRLRPTDGGRRPGTQPVGLGSPPSC